MNLPCRLIFLALLPVAVFASCRRVDYVKIAGGETGEHPAQSVFIESLLGKNREIAALNLRFLGKTDGERKRPKTALVIEMLSSWEHERAFGDIIVSKDIFVPVFAPQENPLAWRTGTSLASCLDGSETLVLANEIAPPFVALKVDGKNIGDPDYPLIRVHGIRVSIDSDKKPGRRLQIKLDALQKILQEAAKELVKPETSPVWIAAGGDVMLQRGATEILLSEGASGIFGGTADMLATADIAVINLEGPVSDRGKIANKTYTFRFIPETAPALQNAGINAVLQANNHAYDFGETAFIDSLSHLGNAGIAVLGAGINDDLASDPFVFTRKDETFRLFGIASFPRERNGWDGANAAATPDAPGMLHAAKGGAEKLKEKFCKNENDTCIDIVFFHGGTEWSTKPDTATRQLYTDLIAAGADLVIGSHPHTVQGFEWVLGKPVFWSLGNYVFAGMQNTDGGDEGLFVRLGFHGGRLMYMEPYALTLNQARTDIAGR